MNYNKHNVSSVVNTVEALVDDYRNALKEIDTLKDKIKELDDRNNALQEEIDELKDQVDDLGGTMHLPQHLYSGCPLCADLPKVYACTCGRNDTPRS